MNDVSFLWKPSHQKDPKSRVRATRQNVKLASFPGQTGRAGVEETVDSSSAGPSLEKFGKINPRSRTQLRVYFSNTFRKFQIEQSNLKHVFVFKLKFSKPFCALPKKAINKTHHPVNTFRTYNVVIIHLDANSKNSHGRNKNRRSSCTDKWIK